MTELPGGDQPDGVRTELILGELGALLLDAGLSVTDVRTSLETVRDATDVDDDMTFSVLPEMIIITANRTGTATIINSAESDLSFRQAARACRLVQHVEAGLTAFAAIPAQIAQIRAVVRSHATLQWILGSALISSGLAILFRCPWWAIVVSVVAGALVGVVTSVLNRIQGAVAIVPFVAALTGTTFVGALAHAAGLTEVPLFAVCAPVAILVPGALITNALLELTARDIVTGSARLLYGIIMLSFMAAGIAAGAALTGLRIDPNSAALVGEAAAATSLMGGWQGLPPLWLSWVGVVILAIGIGLAFGSGARLTTLNVIVMTGTYALLATLTPIVGNVVGTGVTAGVLFVAAHLIERLTFAVPATVSFQPAFLLLVPGTVGLVALASSHASTLAAPATFVSLCIGTKVGAVLTETGAAIRKLR